MLCINFDKNCLVLLSITHDESINSNCEICLRFPNAKIIGSPASEAKLNYINALPRKNFDINCQDKEQLSTLNSQLENEGVKLFYIDGDVCTNAIVAVAHGVALGKLESISRE